MSTPVRSRKSGQTCCKKASVRRNSIKRGRPVLTKRNNGTIPKRQRRSETKSSSSDERLAPQGASAEEKKCESSPKPRARIPTPPPPPPPLSESKRKSLLEYSTKNQSNTNKGMVKSQDQKPDREIIHSLTPPPQQEQITQEPEVIRENSASRMRTKEDLRKWHEWRVSINDQLVSYTMSDKQRHQSQASPVTTFPDDFTEDSISAILTHANKIEKPRSTLDKLSYMIYGIPRVSLSNHPKHNIRHDKVSQSDVENNNFILQQHKPNDGRNQETQSSIKSKSSENLFIQTNPASNIHRYLPSKASKPEHKRHHRKLRNVNEEYHHYVDRVTPIDRTTPMEYVKKPVLYPRFPAPEHSYVPPQSSKMKPPIPGAVPTILSGLQPYDMGRLRHVSRGSRKSNKTPVVHY